MLVNALSDGRFYFLGFSAPLFFLSQIFVRTAKRFLDHFLLLTHPKDELRNSNRLSSHYVL